MYLDHASSFERFRNMILAVGDATDFDASHHLKVGVQEMLPERFREEAGADEEGPYDIRYATDRINGVICGGSGRPGLQMIRDKAAKAGACPDFVEAVDMVLAEARAALAVALRHGAAPEEPVKPTVPLPDYMQEPLGDADLADDRPDLTDV